MLDNRIHELREVTLHQKELQLFFPFLLVSSQLAAICITWQHLAAHLCSVLAFDRCKEEDNVACIFKRECIFFWVSVLFYPQMNCFWVATWFAPCCAGSRSYFPGNSSMHLYTGRYLQRVPHAILPYSCLPRRVREAFAVDLPSTTGQSISMGKTFFLPR